MWHFGKGQALHLGRPSIFITSPLVIWKLASPIFVSLLSLAAPPILFLILFLLSLLFSPYSPFFLSFPVMSHVLCRGEEALLLTWKKIIIAGTRKQDFTHKHTETHAYTDKASGVLRGSGDRMSTPAVRIVVTERRANTNVINTSALTPGTLCVSVFV